jgi:spore coat protein CotH
VLWFVVVAAVAVGRVWADDQGAPARAEGLFEQGKVWDVRLRFSAEAWAGLEPKGGTGNWGTIIALSQRNAARGDTTWTLAETLVKRGYRNGDGRVDQAELRALVEGWFSRWDWGKRGVLDSGQLRVGLDAVIDPEGMLRPGNFPISLEGAAGKRNGLASAMGIEFSQVHGELEFAGETFKDVGVRYKGNGSFVMLKGSPPKRSFKVDLNDYVKGQRLAGQGKLNLHNRAGDEGFLTESVAYRLYREAGVPAPRTAFARVSVTAPPGLVHKYLGLYSVVEEVDEAFAKERFGSKRGAIFKPVTQALFGDLGDDWAAYAHVYDAKAGVMAVQARRVIEFAQLVTYADDGTFARRLGEFLDVDEFARFMAVTVYLANVDSILHTGQNFYLYLDPRTGRFVFIPWDVDGSFGQIFGEQLRMAKLSVDHPWAGTNRFLERVFKVEAFRAAYRARLGEFARTIFEPARFHREVDELARAIRPAVAEESKERLAEFDRAVVKGPAVEDKGLFGTGLFAEKPARSIGRFVDARTPEVADQLAGKSKGEQTKGLGDGGGPWGSRPARGPGQTLAPLIVKAMDRDKDGKVSRAEFLEGWERLFGAWGGDGRGGLTEAELRAGIGKDLAPAAGGLFGRGRGSTRPAATRAVEK